MTGASEVEWPAADAPSDCPVQEVPAAPQEHAVRMYGPILQRDPKELYREMRREHGPVAPILLEGDLPAWLVLGYREVHQVTTDSELFARNSRRWNHWDDVPEGHPLWPWLGIDHSVLVSEGEEHRRRAGAISDALAAVDQFELWDHCARIADRLIDSFAGSGRADLIAEYTDRIPLLVVTTMFGMTEEQTRNLIGDLSTTIDAAEGAGAAHNRVVDRMRALLAVKRERPGNDLPTRLLGHPSTADDDECAIDLVILLTAAHQPTASWIGNTLRLLLTDERFALTLSGGRRSVGDALNEVLWEDSPVSNLLGRWAARDTQLGGRAIRKGDLLLLGYNAANSDPQVWPDGTNAHMAGNHAHMAFGHGEHGCPFPAPELAEVIAKSTIEVLLDRLPDLRLAVEPEALRWRQSTTIRGLVDLPVEFSPTYAKRP
ncbi:cytochrome P450 [Saccharopolyspora erythraea NRRL 2338]|uniref:Cytochrome P450 hydroxylase n=2 Tax=Saccharopolyspora erythraea TaxID=1836 RepID=A4F8V6_SACEN|nr:cytochrome P450 [Saccharopolyspora erythraea]EQD86736.1 cytochrome P450 [Saccharopolyspora erythraea D]PFG94278.1 cytochrome P450 [Saccharopolyspora erythraea NRRL 2338]QRK91048.1 cytochrome P450 [Saccharopolyspora erythraea]CAM00481.1 cytochrome P450 hydroxylase [Saccharopolyspora erythraea NRRL 2338]